MEAFYAEAITINQSFWQEADTDTRFFAGDQTLFNEMYGNVSAARRHQFSFNRILRVVNMVDGHQRKNRKSTIVTGVENSSNETADQFTRILLNIHRQESVLETISDAFRGSLVTGMNLLQVWMDYRSDPVSGNIKVDNCSYNSFIIDPFFRKADLSDCNGIWKRSYVSKQEAMSLLPDKAEDIAALSGTNNMGDSKFQYLPESYGYGKQNLLTYDEFYYRDYRQQEMLVDSETGETMEWRGQDHDLKAYLKQYPQVAMVKQDIPTVKLAIVVQGFVAYNGPQPMGIDQYPFVPVLAYFNPQMPYFNHRVQGIVRGLRDSQYLYNRRKAIELDILESQINSGWKYKENALVNPKDVFLSGQGRGLALKEDAQMSDVEQIIPPGIPQSMIELSRMLGEEISQISGVNEELLGSAQDDKAGILSMLRQGAGLTTLQILFDNLDNAQKLLGKIMIDLIQANYTPGKIQKLLGGEKPEPQFYNKDFGRYDAAVEEGLNTTTQKQMQFAQLLQMREMGIPVPNSVLLEASTMQNKKQLIEAIEKEQQQQAQQLQQQMQSQMELQQAQAELAKARAAADIGLFNERTSRVQENYAMAEERKSQAVRNETSALLDTVKALKELEGVDIKQLSELYAMHQLIKKHEAENALQSRASIKEATPAEMSQPQAQMQQAQEPQPFIGV